ncbi:MAG TPA: GreA/GreB family elongation factor [Candidatus Baltobacteraceae bacterium]|jgi:transcription elongation GreA/GreB family factor
MSRAFMKELEDAPEPKFVSGPREHSITPAGKRALQKKLKTTKDDETRRALQDELDASVVIEPPGDRSIVAFGAAVTVQPNDQKDDRVFTIVGESEMDVADGKITDASPLGKALLGAHVGDDVVWHRPVGDVTLRVKAIRYEDH